MLDFTPFISSCLGVLGMNISISSNPFPTSPLSIRPPHPETKHCRTHQECPVPVRNISIRPRPLFRTPKQLSADGTAKNGSQSPYEKYGCIHSSVLTNAEDFGNEGWKERIVSTSEYVIEHDESQPERDRVRGGYEDTCEPKGEDTGGGQEQG